MRADYEYGACRKVKAATAKVLGHGEWEPTTMNGKFCGAHNMIIGIIFLN